MNLQHVNVKIFVDGELTVDQEQFINIFHRLVAEQAMDQMMIDVADYRHVPAGPGVVMVGLEADYAMDHKDSRYGLRYNRKGALEGSNVDRMNQAYWAARNLCTLLESELDGLKFSETEFELFFNDRALAPNTPETLAEARPEIKAFLRDGLGQTEFEFDFNNDPRSLFGAVVKLGQPVAAAATA